MKQQIVIGLLLGSISISQAIKIEQAAHHRTNKFEFDPIDEQIWHNEGRWVDADTGKYRTEAEYAEEAEALKPSNIYKSLYPFAKEDTSGTKYATSHRCFGSECKEPKQFTKYSDRPKIAGQSLIQTANQKYEDGQVDGMPWEDNHFFESNYDTMALHEKRYQKAVKGDTQKQIHDEEREQSKTTLASWNRKVLPIPSNILGYEQGKDYATTHRCFGDECKEPKKYTKYSDRPKFPGQSLAQLNKNESELDSSQFVGVDQKEGKMSSFRYQDFRKERDTEAGYPAKLDFDKDMHKFVGEHIEEMSGRHLTEREVLEKQAAEEEAKLQKAAETPAFKLKPGMIVDWPGDRFTSTHRCFGHECRGDELTNPRQIGNYVQKSEANAKDYQAYNSENVRDKQVTYDVFAQQSAPEAPAAAGVKAFKVGDLQEHRYPFARAYKKNGWPYDESKHLEDVGGLVNTYWNGQEGRFKSHWELLREQEIAEDKRAEAQANKPAFVVPKNIVDDWTGQRFLEPCYGQYPCPAPPVEKKSLLQLEAAVDLESSAEPYDPSLADVDKIIQRFKEKDAKTEIEQSRMQLGDDPKGGIDKIAAASLKKYSRADDAEIKKIVGEYMTGAKDENGIPNGEQWLQEYHATLAARDLIGQWSEVSEGAMDKFMKDGFSKLWTQYDGSKAGHIDDTQVVPFMRELMTSQSPSVGPVEANPYEFDIVGTKIVTDAEKKAAAEKAAAAAKAAAEAAAAAAAAKK